MEAFVITRVYADEKEESYFEEIAKPLISAGAIGFLSEPEEVCSLIFRKVLPITITTSIPPRPGPAVYYFAG